MMLKKDSSACDSPDKTEGICEQCLRNVDLCDAPEYLIWTAFVPTIVKNFKTGHTFKCDGFIQKNVKEQL